MLAGAAPLPEEKPRLEIGSSLLEAWTMMTVRLLAASLQATATTNLVTRRWKEGERVGHEKGQTSWHVDDLGGITVRVKRTVQSGRVLLDCAPVGGVLVWRPY